MPLATRVGHSTIGVCDIGLPCCPHSRSGTNQEGSAIFEIEVKAVHLLTHHGPTNCPHGGTFASIQGAGLIDCEGLPVTLVSHTTQCEVCGKLGAHSEGSELLEVDF
jgi:hypothetical protein